MNEKPILYLSFDQLSAAKGAAVHIAKFAEALRSRYKLTLITPRDGESDCTSDPNGMRLIEFGLGSGPLLDRVDRFRSKLEEHLQTNSYEAIQFRSIWEGRVAAELAGKAVLLYEANGFPSIELKYHYPGLAANSDLISKLRRQELALLLSAKRVITPSTTTKQYIESLGINGEKVLTIPNGADPNIFFPRTAANNGDDLKQIIYVGTLAPWQGIEILLQALKLGARRPGFDSLRLSIIGPARKHWLRRDQRLVRKFKLDGVVRFIDAGTQDEISEAMASADIAVAPLTASDRNTLQGCSPIKLFEYAACGKAIVASDIPPVREIFADGEHALLYNPRKPAQLRDRLLELANSQELRERLGAQARALVLSRYTWEHAQKALLDCYEEILV